VTIIARLARERGRTRLGWLDSWHSFSFGSYQDSRHMGFRALRVINDDTVAAGRGFGEHGHRDAEIFSYVLSGRLEHRDSLGNTRVIEAGDVQYMSAGSGVLHREINPSASEPVRFLQVWLQPNVAGAEPRYADTRIAETPRSTLLFSASGRSGSIAIRADADVYSLRLGAGERLDHALAAGRGAFVHVIRGTLDVAGTTLNEGDAAAVDGIARIEGSARSDAEVLLFDLA
jgi:redox-sensitive bicupin YhaK (pirin superfamily)